MSKLSNWVKCDKCTKYHIINKKCTGCMEEKEKKLLEMKIGVKRGDHVDIYRNHQFSSTNISQTTYRKPQGIQW